jgi:hypothetical protein
MDAALPTARAERPANRPGLTPGLFIEIAWASLWESLWPAFALILFGSIAAGILGGILGEMTPTLPPGLAGKPSAEAVPTPVWDAIRSQFSKHEYVIVFAAVWVLRVGSRVVRYSANIKHRRAAAWLLRASRTIGQNWFGLLVFNAFGAFIGVMVLQFTNAFSWVGWLWRIVMDLLGPILHPVTDAFSGNGLFHGIGSLFSWYGDNQFKFTFWLLYSAGICDDLGLPNYKTLTRWLWRKLKRRFADWRAEPAQ